MSGISTTNNAAFVEAEQYSQFIQRVLHDGLLPSNFYRNVSDFGSGTTLNIKSIGTAQLQEVAEDQGISYNPIETGNITLTITEYPGDGWYVTDVMRQDGAQIEALIAARGQESTRAIQEFFETKVLAAANAGQVAGDTNTINGFDHRMVASGTNDTLTIDDIVKMKLAFDKANVPFGGRMAIVDAVVEATLNLKFQGTYNVDSNPVLQEVLEGGFMRDHNFVMNFMGWSFISSNRLPTIASETVDGNSVTDGVANIFMSMADDQTKPVMVAWRQMPKVEGERNKDFQRDEFISTARFGVGIQRVDTLGVIITSATAIA